MGFATTRHAVHKVLPARPCPSAAFWLVLGLAGLGLLSLVALLGIPSLLSDDARQKRLAAEQAELDAQKRATKEKALELVKAAQQHAKANSRKEALHLCNDALKLDPDCADALCFRGLLRVKQGVIPPGDNPLIAKGLGDLKRASQLAPERLTTVYEATIAEVDRLRRTTIPLD